MRIYYLLLPVLFYTAPYTISMENTNSTNTITIRNNYNNTAIVSYYGKEKCKVKLIEIKTNKKKIIEVSTNKEGLSSLIINVGPAWEDEHEANKLKGLKHKQYVIISNYKTILRLNSDPDL